MYFEQNRIKEYKLRTDSKFEDARIEMKDAMENQTNRIKINSKRERSKVVG